jgi:pyroglutamyl-peptidase
MSVLLTGFDPFDGETINPSWEAVQGFAGKQIAGHSVQVLCLPTEFDHARELLTERLFTMRPALCLCVGQAGGRALISLEKVAINFAHARIADNAGSQPQFECIDVNGPAAYFAPFDFPRALAALSAAGIGAEISLSAGSFVCNDVFYALCQIQKLHLPNLRGTFVHIPYLPEQVIAKPGLPSMPLDVVQKALLRLLEIGLAHVD